MSMGPIAGRQARIVLEHVERILAIELLCAARALDLRLASLPGTAPGRRRRRGPRRHPRGRPTVGRRSRARARTSRRSTRLVREGRLRRARRARARRDERDPHPRRHRRGGASAGSRPAPTRASTIGPATTGRTTDAGRRRPASSWLRARAATRRPPRRATPTRSPRRRRGRRSTRSTREPASGRRATRSTRSATMTTPAGQPLRAEARSAARPSRRTRRASSSCSRAGWRSSGATPRSSRSTGEPAAYCQFGPLSAYPRAQRVRDLYPKLPSAPLPAVITCIATTPEARGQRPCEAARRWRSSTISPAAASRPSRPIPEPEARPDATSAANPAFWAAAASTSPSTTRASRSCGGSCESRPRGSSPPRLDRWLGARGVRAAARGVDSPADAGWHQRARAERRPGASSTSGPPRDARAAAEPHATRRRRPGRARSRAPRHPPGDRSTGSPSPRTVDEAALALDGPGLPEIATALDAAVAVDPASGESRLRRSSSSSGPRRSRTWSTGSGGTRSTRARARRRAASQATRRRRSTGGPSFITTLRRRPAHLPRAGSRNADILISASSIGEGRFGEKLMDNLRVPA